MGWRQRREWEGWWWFLVHMVYVFDIYRVEDRLDFFTDLHMFMSCAFPTVPANLDELISADRNHLKEFNPPPSSATSPPNPPSNPQSQNSSSAAFPHHHHHHHHP